MPGLSWAISFFAIAYLLPLPLLAQTCIIVYVSNDRIVAGADRLYHQSTFETGWEKDGHHKDSVYYDKKIFSNAHCAWALSGADNLNVLHTTCRQAAGQPTLSLVISSLSRRLRGRQVTSAMQRLVIAAGSEQKKRFKNNMTEIVFLTYEQHLYKAYRVTISMPGIYHGSDKLRLETDSIIATRGRVGVFVLGHDSALGNDLHPEAWVNPQQIIKSLILKQATATPAVVSTTSDLLTMRAGRMVWTGPE